MNRYDPNIHHRKSIRLKGYDYSRAGLYFVTICVQNREHLFGEIDDGKIVLNDAGEMLYRWYLELENKFPDIKCREMITMPNHFHCIVENITPGEPVGADLCVCPNNGDNKHIILGNHPIIGEHTVMGEHIGSPLRRVVQWFKTMTTNEYIRGVKNNDWQPFAGKLWQRNYWEHIIRDEKSLYEISDYIVNNPLNWAADKLNANHNGLI